MKKTILTIAIGLILILTCTINTISTDITKQTEDETYYLAATYGPAWAKLFTKIEIINGDAEQISQIESLLTKHNVGEDENLYVSVEKLTFKVTYKLPTTIFSRFLYYSINTKISFSEFSDFQNISSFQDFKEFVNNSIETLKNSTNMTKSRRHSVTYENFTGFFYLVKPRMFRILPPKLFIPAKFAFVGVCENMIIN
jgi:hypothetical protein